MPDHWPTGSRDTVEWPEVNVEISANLRDHLSAFLKLNGAPWTDYGEQRNRTSLTVQDSRLRTYRKMYERLGLLRKKDDKIQLSRMAQDISLLEKRIQKNSNEALGKLAQRAVMTLARYQLRNPAEAHTSQLPEDCDILPYLCI